MNKKRVLEEELADLEGKLHRAEKLVTGLAGERVRWESSIRTYESALSALPGDTVVAAAFLSYAGPFPSEYRDELVEHTWLPQVGWVMPKTVTDKCLQNLKWSFKQARCSLCMAENLLCMRIWFLCTKMVF
jgi:hypothetical protein